MVDRVHYYASWIKLHKNDADAHAAHIELKYILKDYLVFLFI